MAKTTVTKTYTTRVSGTIGSSSGNFLTQTHTLEVSYDPASGTVYGITRYTVYPEIGSKGSWGVFAGNVSREGSYATCKLYIRDPELGLGSSEYDWMHTYSRSANVTFTVSWNSSNASLSVSPSVSGSATLVV